MNLQQLHYFQKIAECQQYTLAAQELHVTQATLSYAILNLERELNVKLFDRKGKSVLLTECGKAYLSCVRDALQALDRGEQMVKNLSMPAKRRIKLTYLESLKHLVFGMLSDLCAEESEPLLRFDLAHANAALIEQQLIRREVDLGISTAPSTPGVASHLIGHQDNVVIVPQNHPWAHLESIPLSALDGQRFVAYSQDCVIRGYYDFILRSAHVEPDIFAESRVHGNILDMVSYGMGVSIVPRMKRLEERYDLLSLSIQDDIPPRAIYLLWAEGAALPQEVEEFRVRIIENTDLSRYL